MSTVTKMRLSKETHNILKNFAAINSNIIIAPGNVIRTKSLGNNIYAEARVTEEFDVEIPIWDLNQFLGVISMFNNPDLEFNEKNVVISNGRSSITYHYAEPKLLSVATKAPKMPVSLVQFDLNESDLNDMIKAASILQVDELKIVAENGVVTVSVLDGKQSTNNSFKIEIPSEQINSDFVGSFSISELRLIPGSYTVELTDKIISKFTHKNLDLFYNIAIKQG